MRKATKKKVMASPFVSLTAKSPMTEAEVAEMRERWDNIIGCAFDMSDAPPSSVVATANILATAAKMLKINAYFEAVVNERVHFDRAETAFRLVAHGPLFVDWGSLPSLFVKGKTHHNWTKRRRKAREGKW